MDLTKPASNVIRAWSRLLLRLGRPAAALRVFDCLPPESPVQQLIGPIRDRQYLRVARALQQGTWTPVHGEPLPSDLGAFERHFSALAAYHRRFAPGGSLQRLFFGSVPKRPVNRTWSAPKDRPVRVLVASRNIASQKFLNEPIRALVEHGAEVRTHDAEALHATGGKPLSDAPDARRVFLYSRGATQTSASDVSAYIRAADPAFWDAIEWADVVYIEWANQTALWLTQCLPWSKKLVVRCHSYEALTTLPLFLQHGRIDTMIFIAPHVRTIYATHPVDDPGVFSRSVIVQNVRPPETPVTPLPDEQRRFRLGLLGFDRQIKDPLFAIGILRTLLAQDNRWTLVLGGKDFASPEADDKSAAAEYVRAFHAACRDLRDHIEFSGYITDKAPWFAGIGFILSTSLREGSHESVVEGMAHGCIPVIRDWPMAKPFGGASGSFPGLALHATPDSAAGQVIHDAEGFADRSAAFRKLAQTDYFGDAIKQAFSDAVACPVQD